MSTFIFIRQSNILDKKVPKKGVSLCKSIRYTQGRGNQGGRTPPRIRDSFSKIFENLQKKIFLV